MAPLWWALHAWQSWTPPLAGLLTFQLVTSAFVNSVSIRVLAALAGSVTQNVNECWPLSLSAPATTIIYGSVGRGVAIFVVYLPGWISSCWRGFRRLFL